MISKENALALARRGQVITWIGLIGLAGVFVRALAFTPVERTQGPAQKIFYLHLPYAWAALGAFFVTGLLSLLYLWLKDRKIDAIASACAEVGLAFSVAMLTTGPIWGKTIWGTWWTWDARLTSTLFLVLLFIGYKVLRGAMVDPDMRARYSAVIGTLALALVPFIHMTVVWFRTLHPEPVVLRPEGPSMPGVMVVTVFASVVVFTVLCVGFVMQRYALGILRDVREEAASAVT